MQLTYSDIAAARQLPLETLEQLAAEPVIAVRSIPPVSDGHYDPAGVAYRGGSVFLELFDGKYTIEQLAAAYYYLDRRQCQQRVLEAITVAFPIVDA